MPAAFRAAVARGRWRGVREAGELVTFGITPDRPETGYGYLRALRAPRRVGGGRCRSRASSRSPMQRRRRAMVAAGSYLWNAGIFLFAARDIIAAFEAHAPDLMAPVRAAVEAARSDLGFLRLDPEAWGRAGDISIDYAVMEQAAEPGGRALFAAAGPIWAAGTRSGARRPDENGVATSGPATAHRLRDTLLRSEAPGLRTGRDRAAEHRRRRDARRGAGGRHEPRAGREAGGRRR